MYLVIDTETSGLPDYRLPADDPKNPRLAEIAMIYLDADLCPDREMQSYIRPDGWEMDAGATEVNGLTTDFLKEFGVPLTDVLDVYEEAIREGRAIIAYGVQFDCKILRGELRRAGRDDLFMETRNICVMRGAQGIVTKKDGSKGWPKLSDSCAHFDIFQPDAHSALDDARAAAEIARHLRRLDALPEPAVHLAKGR